MKRSVLLVLFLLSGISLLASGHGTNGLAGVIILYGIILFIIFASLLSLVIITGINARKPKRNRGIICALFLGAFTLLFLYYFWHMIADQRASANYLISVSSDQPEYVKEGLRREGEKISNSDLMMMLIYGLYFIANAIFLGVAFRKLKKAGA